MKIKLYFGMEDAIKKSGIGRAFVHQKTALTLNHIDFTVDKDSLDYDILHINTITPDSIFQIRHARNNGKKVIYHAHSTEEDFRNSFKFSNTVSGLYKKWLVYLYSSADVIITPTPYSQSLLESYHLDKPIYHVSNGVNLDDFSYVQAADIRLISEGDFCPRCGHRLIFKKGIEIGNTFKLGTKYSESLGLYYTDQDNKLKPVVMGCYGIGIARILAAYVEQHHDNNGIIFSKDLAPYEVAIVIVNVKDETQVSLAEKIYNELENSGKKILLDNRELRAGVKFKDMDLIGIPKRITVGRKASDGIVEYKDRTSTDVLEVKINEIFNML